VRSHSAEQLSCLALQVDLLVAEVRSRSARGEKVLVTTVSKRMAEDLDLFFREQVKWNVTLDANCPLNFTWR